MATLQTNPSAVPNAVQEWTRELNISELGRVGYMNLGLTEWDENSSGIPYIKAGSIIEINNSLYIQESSVAIDTSLATGGVTNWLYYAVSGSTATAYLAVSVPTEADWDCAKGGFYNSSGDRWTGHYMYTDSAKTSFSKKGFLDYANGAMVKKLAWATASISYFDQRVDVEEDLYARSSVFVSDNVTVNGWINIIGDASIGQDLDVLGNVAITEWLNVVGDTSVGGSLTVEGEILPTETADSSWTIGTSSYKVLDVRGVYFLQCSNISDVQLQVDFSGTWRRVGFSEVYTENGGQLVFSNGSNVRLFNSSGASSRVVRYIRF